jgi:hypothetical protein
MKTSTWVSKKMIEFLEKHYIYNQKLSLKFRWTCAW